MTRRRLMAGAGAVAAAAPGLACAAASAASPTPVPWVDALSNFVITPAGLDAARASGVSMISATVGTAIGPPEAPTYTYEAAVRDIAGWDETFARYPDRLIKVARPADIAAARATGRLGVMINFQNATNLNRDLRNLDFFHGLGVRQIQLTYNEQNEIGAGCIEAHDAGLTAFGHRVVERMNALGIIVDVSHCGDQTTLDAIAASKKPAVITHSNCRAVHDNPRCKTDEAIRRCAAAGGVVGMTTYGTYISARLPVTLDDFMRHLQHAISVAGIEHVGIGSDTPIQHFDGPATPEAFRKFIERASNFPPVVGAQFGDDIAELNGPQKFIRIAEAMRAKGYSSSDVDKVLGGNFLRAYREIMG